MTDYCPGAVRLPQPGGVTLNRSLPPRAVWHITYDALKADGSQPAYSAVRDYLVRVGYCPTIMWDPFTGYMEQFYPASQGARALAAWNEDGAVNVQVEVFFTPGCVRDGVKYATVADTPLVGLDVLLDWMDDLGIPRQWPLGSPQWQGNSRDASVWNAKGGHYGHCHVPDNTHSDPGPMPDLVNWGSVVTESTQASDLASTGTVANNSEDEDMATIFSDSGIGDGKVWVGNGVLRRHVKDPAELAAMQLLASEGKLNLFKNGAVQNLPMGTMGVDVEELTARAVVRQPIAYLDPETGKANGQTTTLEVMGGAQDFQHSATRRKIEGK